jgi:hypothetical protein
MATWLVSTSKQAVESRSSVTLMIHGVLWHRSNYTDADGNKKIMASTQFEALDARR